MSPLPGSFPDLPWLASVFPLLLRPPVSLSHALSLGSRCLSIFLAWGGHGKQSGHPHKPEWTEVDGGWKDHPTNPVSWPQPSLHPQALAGSTLIAPQPGLSGGCPLPSQGSHQKGIVPFSRAEAGDAWQSPGSSSWAGPLAEPKASPFPTPEPREIPTAEKSILAQGLGGALCSYSFPVTGVCIWQEAHGIMHK